MNMRIWSVMALVMWTPFVAAQTGPVWIGRANGAITIDGNISERAWQSAIPVTLMHGAAPPATALLTYDDEALYVAFRATDDSPREARVPPLIHDRLRDVHDWCAIYIDTHNERRKAAVFRIGPRGVLTDSIVAADGEDFSVTFPFDGTARINDSGWTAELRIPLSSLPYAGHAVPTWGVLFVRNHPRDGTRRANVVVPEDTECQICHATTLVADIDVAAAAAELVARAGPADDFEHAAFIELDDRFAPKLIEWPSRRQFRRAEWRGPLPDHAIAVVHTHPSSRPTPSTADEALARKLRLPVYTITRTTVCVARPGGGSSCRPSASTCASGE